MADVKAKFREKIFEAFPRSLLAVIGDEGFDKRVDVLWEFYKSRKEPISVRYVPFGEYFFLQTLMDDQVFLVDTVELTLKRFAIPYRGVVHPIIPAVRDESGDLIDIDEDRGKLESFIHVEILPGVEEETVKRCVEELKDILPMTKAMVNDFVRMKKRVKDAINDVEFLSDINKLSRDDASEYTLFLEWIIEDNFVFFGYGEAVAEDDGVEFDYNKGLGVLRKEFIESAFLDFEEIKDTLENADDMVFVDKLSVDSPIHRPGKLDILVTKLVSESGDFIGWRFWVGLLTKKAISSKGGDVPLLRRKLIEILSRRNVVYASHDYKNIVEIFNSIPMEELLSSTVDEINEIIDVIMEMGMEKEVSVAVRKKKKGLISVLVILPEERFSMAVSDKIKQLLMEKFDAAYVDERFSIYERAIAFLYFFLTPRSDVYIVDPDELKSEIEKLTAEWDDLFKEALKKRFPQNWEHLFLKYAGAFPMDYKATVSASEAVDDVALLEEIFKEEGIKVAISEKEGFSYIKIYSFEELKLSDVVPMLENFHLSIWDEKPFEIEFPTGKKYHLHVYRVLTKDNKTIDPNVYERLSDGIVAVMNKVVESDPLNSLIITAGFGWESVDVLRTYRNYIRQIVPSIAYSTAYTAFRNYPHITRYLWEYFDTKFNPDKNLSIEERMSLLVDIEDKFYNSLSEVFSISEDKVFRVYFNAIKSTIRTNYYRKDKKCHYISIKIDCKSINEMPLPRPMYEIYVHERGVEGVHLRGGKIARGGIRWSDRPDDFRTEILGLMNTQMIKNAIIVPTGAKGGFVVKLRYYQVNTRAELEELVKEKYSIFIRGLLDVTDNIVDGKVVHPPDVVRYDDDDPYLVVAADKGTAKLSDVANSIAREYNFWLDDAFASGGSTGYDHKVMGVTAKGAWVCVKRHFMEMGINPEEDVITVVGIGDMSGDVFGNGLLRSKTVKLIAAFNHRVIFIDPDPDPEKSYQERLRLFREVKDWDHYNPELISKGGGVYRRDAKEIKLSPEAKKALSTDKDVVSGEELIQIILKADVDLLWNGGIGTYVKASFETHAEVGDPSNDNVRVDAKDLRVKVVGEGGNLGFTQKARVEYALIGGRINMDAIDNSGGVDTSDHEVNIKILLSEPLKKGELNWDERNKLIFDIADEVLENVLKDNYTQSLSISLDVIRSKENIEPFIDTIGTLIDDGLIDPEEVYLPKRKELRIRWEKGIGLLRPELSMLIGYQKRWVKEKLRGSTLLKASYLDDYLYNYFPKTLRERFGKYIPSHPLRDEIVLTCIVNSIVDQAGISFFHKMERDHGAQVEEVTASYVMMDGILDAQSLRERIFDLDFKVNAEVQYKALLEVENTIEELVKWSHFFVGDWLPLKNVVEKYRDQVKKIKGSIMALLSGREKEEFLSRKQFYLDAGFPEDLAFDIAIVPFLSNVMDIITLSEVIGMDPLVLAGIYFTVSHKFGIDEIEEAIIKEERKSKWDNLAYSFLHRDLYRIRRNIVERFVKFMRDKSKDIDEFVSREVFYWKEVRKLIEEAKKERAKGPSVWYVIIRKMRESLL